MSVASKILSGQHFFLDEDAEYYIRGEEKDVPDFSLITVFGEKKLKPLFVIVEMYDKKKYGRIGREYKKQFTEKERQVVSRWYLRIYAWYLRTGIPRDGVRMSVGTYSTLLKAANFFASV